MSAYGVFAEYYDLLTGDVDYTRRRDYLRAIFARHGVSPRLVLDLACGTGSMSLALAQAGYDVIGVDRSPQMLSKAAEKAGSSNRKAMFICQDICALDLYGTVDAAVCNLDGINHLTDTRRVFEAFRGVSLFLNPGGLFVFDLNTPYKIAEVLGNNTFVYDYDSIYCVWQNAYRPSTRLCAFDLTFFEPEGGAYRRFDEHFSEKAYTQRQIRSLLAKAGLTTEAVYDDLTFDPPGERCERMIVVAKKTDGVKC